jgi:hypothetical protein
MAVEDVLWLRMKVKARAYNADIFICLLYLVHCIQTQAAERP